MCERSLVPLCLALLLTSKKQAAVADNRLGDEQRQTGLLSKAEKPCRRGDKVQSEYGIKDNVGFEEAEVCICLHTLNVCCRQHCCKPSALKANVNAI